MTSDLEGRDPWPASPRRSSKGEADADSARLALLRNVTLHGHVPNWSQGRVLRHRWSWWLRYCINSWQPGASRYFGSLNIHGSCWRL